MVSDSPDPDGPAATTSASAVRTSATIFLLEVVTHATFRPLPPNRFGDDFLHDYVADVAMQKRSKRRREFKRRKRLKMQAPPDPSVALTMLIYHGGIVTTATWKTEQHYQAMAIFLKKMLGETTDRPREPQKPEFYYLETAAQWDALCEFVHKLSKMLQQA